MSIYPKILLQNEFKHVLEKGQQASNRYLKIFYIQTSHHTNRFGIIINRKFGNAVHRNKAKRQLRTLIRDNLVILQKGYDVVFFLKNQFADLKYNEKEKKLLGLYEKAKII